MCEIPTKIWNFFGARVSFAKTYLLFGKTDVRFGKVDVGFSKVGIGFGKMDVSSGKVDVGFSKVDVGFIKVDVDFVKRDDLLKERNMLHARVDIEPEDPEREKFPDDVISESSALSVRLLSSFGVPRT